MHNSPATDPLTMSSLEITELCGKRHDNVMRDIRYMLESLADSTALKFEASYAGSYKDGTGRVLPCFHLPKRECLILVSGYDVVMRASIIDRWIELETQKAAQEQTVKAAEAAKAVEPDAPKAVETDAPKPDKTVKVSGYKVKEYMRRARRTDYEIAYEKALEGVKAFRNQPDALIDLLAGLHARVELLENGRR